MKVLVFSYSQTGQTEDIINRFLEPFRDLVIDHIRIETDPKYPFPWPMSVFFDAMPETVLEEPIRILPFTIPSADYDLIVLGYQPWFLSPSLPISSLLQLDEFKGLIKDKPVITLSGGRNMWLNAQESIRKHIREAGGRLVANIPLVDRNQNHISLVTIIYWMTRGKKDRKWGIFPRPGVASEDISFVVEYGKLAKEALNNGNWTGLQDRILSLGKITIPTDILFIEERAKRIFRIWARLIKKFGTTPGKRRFLVSAFKYYVIFALFIIAPTLLGIYYLTTWPFTQKELLRKKRYFCGV